MKAVGYCRSPKEGIPNIEGMSRLKINRSARNTEITQENFV
jgi:hypothetical protein